MMMSSPGNGPECPDCKKSFKDSFAVKASSSRRKSGRQEEIPSEPDPIILRQDTELEDLLSSSKCDFTKYDLYI